MYVYSNRWSFHFTKKPVRKSFKNVYEYDFLKLNKRREAAGCRLKL